MADIDAGGRFFAKGKFYHQDAKARMIPITSAVTKKVTAGIFHLNTGRVRDHWHTMTRSGKSPRLSQHMSEPFAEITAEDAHQLGLKNNELLEIETLQCGSISPPLLRVKVSPDISRGMIFVPMHWNGTNSAAARINAIVDDNCDPASGQPALKGSQVQAKRFNALWYGFAASIAEMRPVRAYSAIARTKTGWSCELASLTPVADWEAEAREVLNLNTGNASIIHDAAKGISRVAIYEGPMLVGLFFSASDPITIARAHAISQIQTTVPALTAMAGLPANNHANPGAPFVPASMSGSIRYVRPSTMALPIWQRWALAPPLVQIVAHASRIYRN